MSGKRKPHHSGDYTRVSRTMRTLATADPTATCWRDGKTRAEHGPGAHWTCGHVDNPDLYAEHPSPYAAWSYGNDGHPRLCAPEIAGCNTSHGAIAGNQMRVHTTTRHY